MNLRTRAISFGTLYSVRKLLILHIIRIFASFGLVIYSMVALSFPSHPIAYVYVAATLARYAMNLVFYTQYSIHVLDLIFRSV